MEDIYKEFTYYNLCPLMGKEGIDGSTKAIFRKVFGVWRGGRGAAIRLLVII